MEEERIIEPVDRELLRAELTEDKMIRRTRNGGNEIYVTTASVSPSVMREIGRLREEAFRDAGGGTGKSLDIDVDDIAPEGYRQLIVWDPDASEIIGGYRYIVSNSSHPTNISTEHYFEFTDRFRSDYLPRLIELGRSFVQPRYQGRRGGIKSLYALDNLWDGLGALVAAFPDMNYFLGKVTMYANYDVEARNKLHYFLDKYFRDTEGLVLPKHPLPAQWDTASMERIFTGDDYAADHRILTQQLRSHGVTIPPMINAYMNLSSTMKVFGTVVNPDFGEVFETGILITIADIYQSKKERYLP
ncbi:MAG: GNAT family N-acetyltransferase [Rikenellaceae bacterium]|nr:GNAT family N-acetyltransferase [Rikenellaceae bacterium]